MKDKKPLDWIPIYIDKHIFGSTRLELEPDERSVWQDLLILSGKDNGHIRANEGVPYPLEQLSGLFVVKMELLKRTIKKCSSKEVGKIEIQEDGTMYLPSYPTYKLSARHKRRFESEIREENKEDEDEIFNKMFVKCPQKYSDMGTKTGSIRVSRLVVATILNRSLKPEEEVHHIDKNEKNNRPENLILFKNHTDHTRFEHGKEVEPTWDGSRMTAEAVTMAANEVPRVEKSIDIDIDRVKIEKKKEENIKKKALKKEKLESILKEEFDEFWIFYRSIGNKRDDSGDKNEATKAYKTLRKTVDKKNIAQATNGYADFLKGKRIDDNFEQRKMYASSFLRSKKWQRFLDFKYDPQL